MELCSEEAVKYVWDGAIPLQIHLHESEVTTLPPPPPIMVIPSPLSLNPSFALSYNSILSVFVLSPNLDHILKILISMDPGEFCSSFSQYFRGDFVIRET